jgi:hypothetical protein
MTMIEGLSHVPPVLMMLHQELVGKKSWADMRKTLKGMLKELRDQSEVYIYHEAEHGRDFGSINKLDVHLHGAMDLLTRAGCMELQCRISTAERLSRSMGLVSDRVWISDLITEKFIDFGRPTNEKLDYILEDLIVLFTLFPLIKNGIIKFRTPWIATCSSCMEEFYSQVDATTELLVEEFKSEFKIKKTADGFIADVGSCVEPSISLTGFDQKKPKKKDFIREWTAEQVESIFWTAREASFTGGAVVSNSKIGLAGLLQKEGRFINRHSLELLDSERTFSIPWVSSLNPAQILELREEASGALPLFREKLFQIMSASELSGKSPKEHILELREQAEQVRAELTRTQKYSAKYWKVTYGLLGLGISAYGVGTDQVLPGVGGLLPILQLLIAHKAGHDSKKDSQLHKPAYVLLKAQDILAHAHGKV